MIECIILAVVALVGGIVIGETHLLSSTARGIRLAIQRRRDRRMQRERIPEAWAEHIASLNRPAVLRRPRT